jgi:hypothetical protein
MRVVDVLNDSPKVHGEGDVSFQLSDEVLFFIDERVRADCCTTLETGAGISTIVFAMNHSRHFCITPDAAQAERVTGYCLGHGITMDAVQFEIGRSEQVLPRLALPRLDLVLIDGRHGFPTPFIDWYYTAEALKSGGVLIIDDVSYGQATSSGPFSSPSANGNWNAILAGARAPSLRYPKGAIRSPGPSRPTLCGRHPLCAAIG